MTVIFKGIQIVQFKFKNMPRRSKRTSTPTAATMGQVESAYRGQHTVAHFASLNPRNAAGFNTKRKETKEAKRLAKRRKKALIPRKKGSPGKRG